MHERVLVIEDDQSVRETATLLLELEVAEKDDKAQEGTDGVESDHDPKPENVDRKDYENLPGNQT